MRASALLVLAAACAPATPASAPASQAAPSVPSTSASVSAVASQSTGGAPVTLNVVFYSGDVHDNYVKAVVEPYIAAHPNVTINLIGADSSAQMLAQLRTEKANPTLDVTMQDLTVAQVGYNEALLQPLDPTIVTNLADLDPQAKFADNQGAGVTFDSFVLCYDPTKVNPAPTSWKDVLDPKFKGQIGTWATPDLEGLFLLIAVDKALGADYKTSIQPALDALHKAADNIQTFAPNPDVYPLIIAGQMQMGTAYNARAQLALDTANGKMAIASPKEGVIFQINRINLVAGSKNAAAAQEFINYALSPEAQAAFTKIMFYSPTNPKAVALLPTDIVNRTASAPGISYIPVDWEFLIKNRDDWDKQYQAQIVNR
jgi:putative spermidine/putrescine transport system substrate-binding protein